LDLSYCEESSINYNIPVIIDEDNLFKYDPNSDYYTDDCNTYTTGNGTDILLNDRIEEFKDKNLSLCENICDYVGYNTETKKVICECGIKYKELILSGLDNQTDLLANNLTKGGNTLNLEAMKCYELLFSKDGLLKNIGSYILIFIIILHLVSIIIYYKCGYQIIDNNIQDIMEDKKKIQKLEKKVNYKKEKKNSCLSEQKLRKSKFNNFIGKKADKNKKNKKRISGNPAKKKKKKFGSDIYQDNSNSSNNNIKSFTKLKIKLKESKKVTNADKEPNRSSVKLPAKKKKDIDVFNIKVKHLKLNYGIYNDFELNTMNYRDALQIDKRNYFEYYLSLIKTKQPIIFSFFPIHDFNVFIIKICLFFLTFVIYYASNTVFFNASVIHHIYENKGNYDLVYLFPQIFYSFIISYIIIIFIKYFSLSERDILEIKSEKTVRKANEKVPKIERCIIIKNICYFIISIVFCIIFWYYLSSICALYKNSQVHLIKNTFFSFALGLIYPFFINLLPGIFRIHALRAKNKEFIYKISKIIQFL
jgi:hypothetical protein